MQRTRPNILFLVMDTARAKTAFDSSTMPNFRDMADKGTTFTRAFSTAPWTLPSHASMFSGQYTSDHETHAGSKLFDPKTPTLAELLRGSGYETVGFSNNAWVSPEFGFDRGFDNLRTSMQLVKGGADLVSIAKENNGFVKQAREVSKTLLQRDGHRTLINAVYSKYLRDRYDSGARLTNWRIKRWLSNRGTDSQPFFMFVNYLEPHLEYDPPQDFKYRFRPDRMARSDLDAVNQDAWAYICNQVEMDERDFEALTALYRAELNYLDYRLGNLFEFLDDEGILSETMVVITGDHGENIGNHGLMDHQYCLYDTLLHVPLFVRYREVFPAGEQCDELVELRDIFPTLLEAAGIEIPQEPDVSTHSLQQTLESGGRERVFAEYVTPQPSMNALEERVGTVPDGIKQYDRALRSVRDDEWKFIWGSDGSEQLYHLAADTRDTVNVADTKSQVVERKTEEITHRFGRLDEVTEQQAQNVDAATEARLEDLGYL